MLFSKPIALFHIGARLRFGPDKLLNTVSATVDTLTDDGSELTRNVASRSA
jgi:hypothetical protein